MFKIEAVENEASYEKEEKAVVTVEDTVKFCMGKYCWTHSNCGQNSTGFRNKLRRPQG